MLDGKELGRQLRAMMLAFLGVEDTPGEAVGGEVELKFDDEAGIPPAGQQQEKD